MCINADFDSKLVAFAMMREVSLRLRQIQVLYRRHRLFYIRIASLIIVITLVSIGSYFASIAISQQGEVDEVQFKATSPGLVIEQQAPNTVSAEEILPIFPWNKVPTIYGRPVELIEPYLASFDKDDVRPPHPRMASLILVVEGSVPGNDYMHMDDYYDGFIVAESLAASGYTNIQVIHYNHKSELFSVTWSSNTPGGFEQTQRNRRGGTALNKHKSLTIMEFVGTFVSPPSVMLFAGWYGMAFHIQIAIRQRFDESYANIQTIILAGSSTLQGMVMRNEFPNAKDFVEADNMERTVLAAADQVVISSAFSASWLISYGFKIPKGKLSIVRPSLSPWHRSRKMEHKSIVNSAMNHKPSRQFVYWGSIDDDGLVELVVEVVGKHLVSQYEAVTIVDSVNTGAMSATVKLKSKSIQQSIATALKMPVTILHQSQLDVIKLLTSPGPSLYTNAVITIGVAPNNCFAVRVQWCLFHELPFVAPDINSVRELFPTQSQAANFIYDGTASSLSEKLGNMRLSYSRYYNDTPAVSDVDGHAQLTAIVDRMVAEHRRHEDDPPLVDMTNEEGLPIVTVVIIGRNRGSLLEQALRGVAEQDYPSSRMDVVVYDDASDDPITVQMLSPEGKIAKFIQDKTGWVLERSSSNQGDGASRNAGAAASRRGSYIVFVDDDNVPKPHMVSTFVKAILNSKADVMPCILHAFSSLEYPTEAMVNFEWVPLGSNIAGNLFVGDVGDSAAIFRRDAFERVGGFSEMKSIGYTDWEMMGTSAFKLNVEVIPVGLVWYRQLFGKYPRISSKTWRAGNKDTHMVAQMRAVQPYLKHFGEFASLIMYAKGIALHSEFNVKEKSTAAIAPASAAGGAALATGKSEGEAEYNSIRDFTAADGSSGVKSKQWSYGCSMITKAVHGVPANLQFKPLPFDTAIQAYRDTKISPTLLHTAKGSFPGNGLIAIRRWKSDFSGPIRIQVVLNGFDNRVASQANADGVVVMTTQWDDDYLTVLSSHVLSHVDTRGTSIEIMTKVKSGASVIDVCVHPRQSIEYDDVQYSISIWYVFPSGTK